MLRQALQDTKAIRMFVEGTHNFLHDNLIYGPMATRVEELPVYKQILLANEEFCQMAIAYCKDNGNFPEVLRIIEQKPPSEAEIAERISSIEVSYIFDKWNNDFQCARSQANNVILYEAKNEELPIDLRILTSNRAYLKKMVACRKAYSPYFSENHHWNYKRDEDKKPIPNSMLNI